VDEGCVPYGFDPDPPEGMCRSATDCAVYEVCHATGDPPLCGMCAMRENPCTEDAECEDGTVCDYQRGTEECPRCDPGKECVPPCADDGECPEGQLCHETGHCVDLTCSSARDCPALFVCKPGDPSVCRRATCQDQAPCPSGGRCVNDQCWQDFGTCETPPP